MCVSVCVLILIDNAKIELRNITHETISWLSGMPVN